MNRIRTNKSPEPRLELLKIRLELFKKKKKNRFKRKKKKEWPESSKKSDGV